MGSSPARIAMAVATASVLGGCFEIDPSYAESLTSGVASSTSGDTGSSTAGDTASGDEVGSCDCTALEVCAEGACVPPTKILFVNLDGVTTSFGVADATMDSHNLFPELVGAWDGYSDDMAVKQALLDALSAQWAPYRVVVTDQRPGAGEAPYMMVVVTASAAPEPHTGSIWIAFPDCNDAIPQDVALAFMQPGDGLTTQQHANFISQAISRTLGLVRSDSPADITGSGSMFLDECVTRVEEACPVPHPEYCDGDLTQQNAHRELEALLGLAG